MAEGGWPRIAAKLLALVPKNAMSRLAGRVVRACLPGPLQRAQIRLFGSVFGVDFEESRDPIASFACFQDFFTRALRDGARPVDTAPDALVSPCDGCWGTSGTVAGGQVLQVKGSPYSLAELLGSADDAAGLEGGSFATFYLSPRDYHRFHAPCAGRFGLARHLPGALWPVNRVGLEGVSGLFARNERICARFEVERPAGGVAGVLWLVAVGATMVGSVRVAFDDLTTNRRGAEAVERDYGSAGRRYEKGEEWGRFEFGSTIVMIAAPGLVDLEGEPQGAPLVLGTRIGSLR